jgi:hypothetical protein
MPHWTENESWSPTGRWTGFLATSTRSWSLLAWSLLENSDNIAPRLLQPNGCRFGLPRLRIWADPCGLWGGEPYTLTVYQPWLKEQSIVRKAHWRSTSDFERMRELVEAQDRPVSIDPTITVTDATVPGPELEAILLSGQNLRLPIVKLKYRDSVTSDVGSMGIEFYTLN